MLDAVAILAESDEVTVSKSYAGGTDVFAYYLDQVEKLGNRNEVPCVLPCPTAYVFSLHKFGLTFLASVARESSPLQTFSFLETLAETFQNYFKNELREEVLLENISTVYQLLDEICDGMPFTTEANLIEDIIPRPNLVQKVVTAVTGSSILPTSLPPAIITRHPWRRENPRVIQNEVEVDQSEEINCTLDREGKIVYLDIIGVVSVSNKLSGTPEISLRFNDSSLIDTCIFHRCVRKSSWLNDSVVVCIPPDGTFKLMKYRATTKNINVLPMYVKPQLAWNKNVLTVRIMLGLRHNTNRAVENVGLRFCLPDSTISCELTPNHGQVTVQESIRQVLWEVKSIPSDISPHLLGTIQISEKAETPLSCPAIQVYFKAPDFTPSGNSIQDLKVKNVSGYIKSTTQTKAVAGKFFVRP